RLRVPRPDPRDPAEATAETKTPGIPYSVEVVPVDRIEVCRGAWHVLQHAEGPLFWQRRGDVADPARLVIALVSDRADVYGAPAFAFATVRFAERLALWGDDHL